MDEVTNEAVPVVSYKLCCIGLLGALPAFLFLCWLGHWLGLAPDRQKLQLDKEARYPQPPTCTQRCLVDMLASQPGVAAYQRPTFR